MYIIYNIRYMQYNDITYISIIIIIIISINIISIINYTYDIIYRYYSTYLYYIILILYRYLFNFPQLSFPSVLLNNSSTSSCCSLDLRIMALASSVAIPNSRRQFSPSRFGTHTRIYIYTY